MTRTSAAAIALSLFTGCWTFSDSTLPALDPSPPPLPPAIVYSIGDFAFAVDDGEPKHSTLDGRLLSEEVMERWRARGYVSSGLYLQDERPGAPKSDYALSVRGLQRNRANFWAQGFNMITLALLPYRITHEYEIEFQLEERATGAKLAATARATDTTWVELFLIFGMPFANRGHEATMQRVGDQLYDQLCSQGAFGCAAVPAPPVVETRIGG